MPDVEGQQLDVALSDIERKGFSDEVEVLGGGMFGIRDESNWEVCDQSPAAGQVITKDPRLTVDRSCDDDDVGAPEASESASEETDEPTETSTKTPKPAKPAKSAKRKQRARAMEKAFLANIPGNGIKDMCDAQYTHWACFYDGVEGGPYLQVNLSTDGGRSDAELDEMADRAGLHWFNFIGCDFPDLDTIVVSVNGLDHNVFRHDTQVDSMC
jgi:hypothetical protein